MPPSAFRRSDGSSTRRVSRDSVILRTFFCMGPPFQDAGFGTVWRRPARRKVRPAPRGAPARPANPACPSASRGALLLGVGFVGAPIQAITERRYPMQKNVRKMSLSRETLRVLDSTALQQAEGGALPVQGNTTQRTALSLCFVCN